MKKILIAAEVVAAMFGLAVIAAIVTLPPLAPVPGCSNALTSVNVSDPWVRISFVGDINNVGAFNVRHLLENADAVHPHLIVIGGDTTHGDATALKLRYTLDQIRQAGCRAPIVVAPGNHDVEGDTAAFEKAFGGLEARVELGDTTVVVLNGFRPEAEVAASIRAAATFRERRLIFVLHEPLIDMGDLSAPAPKPGVPLHPAVVEALKEAKPDLVLSGHAHGFWEFDVGGVRNVVVGGRGKDEGDDAVRALAFIEDGPNGLAVRSPPIGLPSPVAARVHHGLIRIIDKAMRGKIDSVLIFVAALAPFVAHAAWIVKRRKRPAPEDPPPAPPVL